ncbi:inorganic triphosphatase [Nitrosomonas aestuarii]|uniref:CYTH domain-containing protein n=1 Tax=Nitrosomonas aestuarii TaxID=52441 RepID=UPI000D31106F|nr:CYTH domain-containing protein [Nitrosomonas aestuarii]PTN09448.1 CYTH domain-containing protein [Nitrosomonas aestuarii]
MSTEVELKLRFPPRYSCYIKQLQLLNDYEIKTPIKQKLHSIYYDSPDFILRQHRIGLRMRKIENQWIQTIKNNGTIYDGLHRHNEWEYPVTHENPDFSHITDQDLKKFFADEALRKSLQSIFVTDFQRTTYFLKPGKDFILEFCIDEGSITANQLTQPICEIELELKSGGTSQLLQFSATLQKQCSFSLIPENTNKAMRGYALLTQSLKKRNAYGESDN